MEVLNVYYADIANMGDQLNKLIIEHVFGYSVRRCSVLDGELSAIGSGLDMLQYHGTLPMKIQQRLCSRFNGPILIWGTGFIQYPQGQDALFFRKMDFRAVRGKLSLARVSALMKKSLDIPTGDAGILCPMLLDALPSKKHELGIVPHLCDRKAPELQILRDQYPDALFIDPRENAVSVLEKIASCSHILSSSLHGLIAADAFSIPNRHIVISDAPKGDGFKYADYYSSYGLPHPVTDIRCSPLPSMASLEEEYCITPGAVSAMQERMLQTFPYPLVNK